MLADVIDKVIHQSAHHAPLAKQAPGYSEPVEVLSVKAREREGLEIKRRCDPLRKLGGDFT